MLGYLEHFINSFSGLCWSFKVQKPFAFSPKTPFTFIHRAVLGAVDLKQQSEGQRQAGTILSEPRNSHLKWLGPTGTRRQLMLGGGWISVAKQVPASALPAYPRRTCLTQRGGSAFPTFPQTTLHLITPSSNQIGVWRLASVSPAVTVSLPKCPPDTEMDQSLSPSCWFAVLVGGT